MRGFQGFTLKPSQYITALVYWVNFPKQTSVFYYFIPFDRIGCRAPRLPIRSSYSQHTQEGSSLWSFYFEKNLLNADRGNGDKRVHEVQPSILYSWPAFQFEKYKQNIGCGFSALLIYSKVNCTRIALGYSFLNTTGAYIDSDSAHEFKYLWGVKIWTEKFT